MKAYGDIPAFARSGDEYSVDQCGVSTRLWLAATMQLPTDTTISDYVAEKLVGRPRPEPEDVLETISWALDVQSALRLRAADSLIRMHNNTGEGTR